MRSEINLRPVVFFLVVFIAIVGMTFGVTGCAPGVKEMSQAELSMADYGSYPEDYQQAVKDYMNGILIDPDSARYSNWKGPSKGSVKDSFAGYVFGYRVCVDINAKNSFGGYTGNQRSFFIVRDGKVAYRYGSKGSGTVGEQWANNLCSF
jgi:hypothetical protein